MVESKPTILFIPGAWFPSSTYSNFISLIEGLRFPLKYAPYPSLNPSDPTIANPIADTRHILENSLLPLVEVEGKDIVIVTHSYGGVSGSAVAKGFGKVARTKAKKNGGVVGLIHIAGFVLPEGASVADGVGGALPDWVLQNEPSTGLALPQDPVVIFAADVDPMVARKDVDQLMPHALSAFLSPAPASAWGEPDWEGRLAYVICTADQAIPKSAQEAMLEGTGMSWIKREIVGSHNAPFSRNLEETISMVEEFVQRFLELDA